MTPDQGAVTRVTVRARLAGALAGALAAGLVSVEADAAVSFADNSDANTAGAATLALRDFATGLAATLGAVTLDAAVSLLESL